MTVVGDSEFESMGLTDQTAFIEEIKAEVEGKKHEGMSVAEEIVLMVGIFKKRGLRVVLSVERDDEGGPNLY